MKSRILPFASFALLGAALALTACVNVKKSDNGDNVDVKTPFGSVSVRTDQVRPEEPGLSVYPGSHLVPKRGHDHDRPNVNIPGPWGRRKVIAFTYHSEDSADR